MTRKKSKRRRKLPRIQRRTAPGAVPGSLRPAADGRQPTVTVVNYNQSRIDKKEISHPAQIRPFLNNQSVTWVNVDGLGDVETLQQIGDLFQLHRLAVEDVVNVHQRPKVEEYDNHLFIVVKMISFNEHLESEQVSMFVGSNYVLTFQVHSGDCFDPIRERLEKSRGRIREAGADYLAYSLLDAIVDAYFPVVDRYGERLERLDELLTEGHSGNYMGLLHVTRGDLMMLRRAIRPLRDEIVYLVRDSHPLISSETQVYLRDCYDHTYQLIDLLDNYREMCSDIRDYYLSIMNNRMNEVMKVLTIIGTIFIPLSFIASLYGMNFNTNLPGNMPELNLPYGYVGSIIIMSAVAMGLLYFMWTKGWLSKPNVNVFEPIDEPAQSQDFD